MICPACDHDNLPGADICSDCGMDLAGLDVSEWGVDPQDPVVSVPLGQLPLKEPITLGPDATVAEAIERMQSRGEGCVFVLDEPDGALVGVLTEHDVTARVAARARNPAETRVAQVMTPSPMTLLRDDPLAWALNRMGVEGYRHLPVLDRAGGRLIGFLSVRSVLRLFLES